MPEARAVGGLRITAVAALLLAAAGCVPRYVVPEALYRQVDRSVGFAQLRQDAARHAGASVLLGGAVLDAKLTPEGTLLEVLQLPLDAGDRPVGGAERSEGRFLLLDTQRTDPTAFRSRAITTVAQVLGARAGKVDEVEYSYPWLSARFIHVWRDEYDYPYSYYPYYPAYGPYPYPYAPYYSPYYYADPFFWYAPYFYGSFSYYGHSGGHSHHEPPRRFEPPGGGGGRPPAAPRPPSGGGGGGRVFK